jgi:hypothetical protein
VLAGAGEFFREVAGLLLEEYDRWLVGVVLFALAVGALNEYGPGWAAHNLFWIALAPPITAAVVAGVRASRRLAIRAPAEPLGPTTQVVEGTPALRFETPLLTHRGKGRDAAGAGVLFCASIVNCRHEDGGGTKAVGAIPRISWRSDSERGAVEGPIDGRWMLSPQFGALDLLPNGRAYSIEVALRLPGEDRLRLVGSERSYLAPEGRVSVTVTVEGSNFAPISATYGVWAEEADIGFDDHPASR